MKIATFLKKNLLWNCSKNHFDNLVGETTTQEQLFAQLTKLAEKYYPQRQKIDTTYTEFCLNDIALRHAGSALEKCAMQRFDKHWRCFLRLKKVFNNDWAMFPSDGQRTRLEAIAQLVISCTQNTANQQTLEKICEKIRNVFDLEERESRNLENVLSLFATNHFCALCTNIFEKRMNAEKRFAQTTDISLKTEFVKNENLRHAYYFNEKICANVDCLGNSATKFIVPTKIDVQTRLYARGRNVFDTFCDSKFGKRTAEFRSVTNTLQVTMQYFLNGTMEIRRYNVKNLGKNKTITADFSFAHTNASAKTTYFSGNNALCLAVGDDFYCALALVAKGNVQELPFREGQTTYTFSLKQNGEESFDLVTIYAENMPSLHEQLQRLNCFGATKCPFAFDTDSYNCVNFTYPLPLTAHGYTMRTTKPKKADTLNFTYQFGNDIATFLDNNGNCTTLLNGFVFGVGGEKVFSIKNGIMTQLNCGKFTVSQDVCYTKPNGTTYTMLHGESKILLTQYATPQKTLFYFPLENKMQITRNGNTFTLKDNLREFTLHCFETVESFTTNALECNEQRLRYKLSNDLTCGTCLSICFKTAATAKIKITRNDTMPKSTPLVQESLTSTYLNCINEKNAFCLQNYLKRADSLTVAAIVFTNPNFVRNYLLNAEKTFFYDAAGQKKNYFDRLALPLASVYYANVTNDTDFWTEKLKEQINDVIFAQNFTGRDLCTKALILKKAAQLKIFDKVRCLIEYNNVKKIITTDAKLFGYAQAIGAVPLLHPSKERLKDLCNQYQIPKSWYYVSQLENLYGLSFFDGALRFQPKVTQENVLEQLSLRVADKRIDTTFLKSTVQSMTLNGTQYFAAFKPQNLKKENNTLVVRY